MGKKRHITFEKKVLNIRRRGGGGGKFSSHAPPGTLLLSNIRTRIYFMLILRQNLFQEQWRTNSSRYWRFSNKNSSQNFEILLQKSLFQEQQLSEPLSGYPVEIDIEHKQDSHKTFPQQLFPELVLKSTRVSNEPY